MGAQVLPKAPTKHAVQSTAKPKVSPQQIRKADQDVGNWFMGLLNGNGSGPSQIIVTAILGCVPVVGQLFDLRDLIKGIILVATNPTNVLGWVDLMVTLVGCIPGFGDAFKAGFKLARSGENAERVFDAMRKYAKFDPKKALKELDWNKLKKECLTLLNKMIDEFIDVLDSWLAKQVIGRPRVDQFLKMLRQVKQDAPKYINAAFAEIQKTINQMLNKHPALPTTGVAKTGGRQIPPKQIVTANKSKSATHQPAKVQRGGASQQVKEKAPTAKSKSQNETQIKKSHEIRQAKKKRWSTGVPAEHIVDYYTKEKRKTLRKLNDNGRLIEEYDRLKRNAAGDRIRKQDINQTGLDHLWFGSHKGRKYLVGETKGSIFGQFAFLSGMSQSDAKTIEDNRSEIGKIFDEKAEYSENTSLGNRTSSAETSIKNEGALTSSKGKAGLSGTKKKGIQMSHLWIIESLKVNTTISNAHKENVIDSAENYLLDRTRYPSVNYGREIFMVTGIQYEKHDRSKGKIHNVQMPIITLADNVLTGEDKQ